MLVKPKDQCLERETEKKNALKGNNSSESWIYDQLLSGPGKKRPLFPLLQAEEEEEEAEEEEGKES